MQVFTRDFSGFDLSEIRLLSIIVGKVCAILRSQRISIAFSISIVGIVLLLCFTFGFMNNQLMEILSISRGTLQP